MTVGPALVRIVLFAAIIMMVGSACFRIFVLPRARAGGSNADLTGGMRATASRWGFAASVLLIPAVLGVLAFQFAEFRDPFEPLRAELALLLDETSWGAVWKLQAVIAGAAFVAFDAADRRRGSAFWVWASSACALAVGVTPALSGHSFAADPRAVSIAADAVHVLGAGAWMGTLAVLVLAAGARARELGGRGIAALVVAFSPLALASAGAVVLTGLFAWWLHVGSVAALWTSSYGRILLFKVLVVACAAALGAFNWRRATPRLQRGEGAEAFLGRSAPAELAAALVVVAATAFLVGSPPP